MLKELTRPRDLPRWFWPATSIAFSLLLLWISLSWLQWKLQYGFQRPLLWDGGSQRCFDNAEPFMPLAALLHSTFCQGTEGFINFTTSPWPEFLARVCLFGGIVVVWLAARTLSGWWAAGVAAAYVATSPLLFALDKQATPAALSILAAGVSCWLALEAFSQPDRRASVVMRYAWAASALVAVSLYIEAVWLVLGQALYGLSRTQRPGLQGSAAATATVVAIACIVMAFTPAATLGSSVVHADVRALPVGVFGFSWPDEWLRQPHMATYISIAYVAILLAGALAARMTVLPFLVAAAFSQVLFGLLLSDDRMVKSTSLGYATIVMALAIGALTNFLMQRRPHTLAFVLPALLIATQYAAFGRLALLHYGAFDFDSPNPPPIPQFTPGNHAILYHDDGHGDRITVHDSMDAFFNSRDAIVFQTDAPVTVRAVIPYRVRRGISYAYEVVDDASDRKLFLSDYAMWMRPDNYQCVRQPYSKVRLYDIPNPAFREDGHSTLMPPGTIFRINDVQTHPYEPELYVDIPYGPQVGKSGWVYAQILLRQDDFLSGERAMHFPCS